MFSTLPPLFPIASTEKASKLRSTVAFIYLHYVSYLELKKESTAFYDSCPASIPFTSTYFHDCSINYRISVQRPLDSTGSRAIMKLDLLLVPVLEVSRVPMQDREIKLSFKSWSSPRLDPRGMCLRQVSISSSLFC